MLQVFFRLSIKTEDGAVLETTRLEEGGSGVPRAFVIGKGLRAPRGWELTLLGMSLVLHVISMGFRVHTLWRSYTPLF
jgi:hypothetical protein